MRTSMVNSVGCSEFIFTYSVDLCARQFNCHRHTGITDVMVFDLFSGGV